MYNYASETSTQEQPTRETKYSRKRAIRDSQNAIRSQLELEKVVAFALIDVQNLQTKSLGTNVSLALSSEALADLFDAVNKYTEKPTL